ncbi:MAG: phosphatidate cytidylyltransferase [Bacteroidales bacterium]|jgi:phosphatidate cytidylyltransferase|nr:phosphatidate cytidylyltransferase [Bacteroidales bacterium]
MRNLLTRTFIGILFLAVVIGSFFLPHLCFYLLFTAFAIIGMYEYIAMMHKIGYKIQWLLPILITLLLCSTAFCFGRYADTGLNAGIWIRIEPRFIILPVLTFIAIWLIPIVELYRKQEQSTNIIATALWPLLWIAMPFALVILWQSVSSGVVLAMLIIIWTYDTLAYCTGSLFGKHRLFERISPKKSWEGLLVSLLLTSAIATLFYFIPYFQADKIFTTIWHWTGFAAIIIVSATFGDLVESMLKRGCQVKDSGYILPGHGGILDRFDSLLFAAPLGAVYYGFFSVV